MLNLLQGRTQHLATIDSKKDASRRNPKQGTKTWRHSPNPPSKHNWTIQSLITGLFWELSIHLTSLDCSRRQPWLHDHTRSTVVAGNITSNMEPQRTKEKSCEGQSSLAIDDPGLVLVLLALSPPVPTSLVSACCEASGFLGTFALP